jgi:pyruvate dehydrogenase E2 component (dihydrolipoamide acetyltransferase)
MDALGIAKAHMVGHSLGGAVAAKVAEKAGGRVLSLGLVAPVGLGPEINGQYITSFVKAASRRDLKPALELLFANTGLVSRQLVDDVLKFKRLDGVDRALGALATALFADGRQQHRIVEAVRSAGVPVTVVFGRDDKIIPSAHAEALKGVARIELIDGAGHMPMMEAAKRVNELLAAQIGGG